MTKAACYSTMCGFEKFWDTAKEELDLCDTRMHWHDLDQRARFIDRCVTKAVKS